MTINTTPSTAEQSLQNTDAFENAQLDGSGYAMNSSNAWPEDFLTLTKPGVLLLVIYTAAIGLILSPTVLHPALSLVIVFSIALGSGGAAAFNMWYDRDIDRLMNRTQKRPIPQNRIAPKDALIFAWLLSMTSLVIMYMVANWQATALLAFSIFFYAVIYTMVLKRNTPQNIVIGGAAGAFPPVIGWVAAGGSIMDPLPWLLFAVIFIWTPSHFWALAVYRSSDYSEAKVPMMPITAGIPSTKRQIVVYSLLLVVCSFLVPFIKSISWFYMLAAGGLGAVYLFYALQLLVTRAPKNGMKLFGYSIFYLFLLFSSLVLDGLFL